MSSQAIATQFEVVAITPGGEVRRSRVAAESAAVASDQVQRTGLRVLSCAPARRLGRVSRGNGRIDVAQFTFELAALLDAGLGMMDAIRTLGRKERAGAQRAVFERITQLLTEGQSLSQALAATGVFPQMLVAAVTASEQSGDLTKSLRRYAEHQNAMRALRGRMVGAAIYPVTLLVAGLLVVIFLLGIVVPRFAPLIEGSQRDLPLASSVLMALGTTIGAHPMVFGGALALLLSALGVVLVRGMRSGWRLAGMQRLWVVGPLIRLFRQAQFFRTAGMLVGGGVPVVRAMSMSADLLTPEDQRALGHDHPHRTGALGAIAQGRSMSSALGEAGVADDVALRMLEVAERTGQLAPALERIAQFQEYAMARALDVASRLIEPALMVLIGLVIGGIVVLMYLPIFDLASGLQ
jgi:general secretion pathway protein F